MAFGLLAFVNEAAAGSTVSTWLLLLIGLSYFFVWGSICLSHIRFRQAWKAAGRVLDELPFKSQHGVWGSYVGCALVVLYLIATFYISLFPIGGSPNAQVFFESYIAALIVIVSFLFWKVYTKNWSFFVKLSDMDLDIGRREFIALGSEEPERKMSVGRRLSRAVS